MVTILISNIRMPPFTPKIQSSKCIKQRYKKNRRGVLFFYLHIGHIIWSLQLLTIRNITVTPSFVLMKSSYRTGLRAFVAENALCSILPLAGFFVYLHIHRTGPQASAATDTFTLVASDAQERKIAHGLEKHRDRAQVFAERPVIFEYKGKRNACNIVKRISGKEQPEHNLLQMRRLHQKETGYQR